MTTRSTDTTASKPIKEGSEFSEMDEERPHAVSSRLLKLAQQFSDKEFRDSYVAALTRRFLARQMRKFRGDLSQIEFAERLGKQQTIVSRLENPNYSGWTLSTLLEIANKLNVGVIVRFVDFSSFLKDTEDFSESAIHPASYDKQQVDDFARSEAVQERFIEDIVKRPENLENALSEGVTAKKDARNAQKEAMERGLFGPERSDRQLLN